MLFGLATSFCAYSGLHKRHVFPPFADAVEFVALEKSAALPPDVKASLEPYRVSSQDYLLSSPFRSWFADGSLQQADYEIEIAKVLSGRFFGVTLKVLDPQTELPWDKMLSRGRAPVKNRNEVAIGAGIEVSDIAIAGSSYEVVGWFRPEITAFRRCLLAYDSPSLSSSLLKAGFQPSRADLFETASAVLASQRKLLPGYEPRRYLRIIHSRPLQFSSFFLYLWGVGVLYWGGIQVTWQLIEQLKGKPLPVLHVGLSSLSLYRRSFFTVNYLYFGAVTVLYLMVYFLPDLQGVVWSFALELARGRTGVLGWAGEAYGTGSVAYAALVTLVINLFRATLRDITLPSMIIPGVGMLTGMFRALLWGVMLSPTTDVIAHKFKLVNSLEGEGYVMAMLFALQIYWAVVGPKGTRWSEYKRALVTNLNGLLIVGVILALSALVEAVMMLVFMKRF